MELELKPCNPHACPSLKIMDSRIGQYRELASKRRFFGKKSANIVMEQLINERATFQAKVELGDCPGIVKINVQNDLASKLVEGCGIDFLEFKTGKLINEAETLIVTEEQ
jgi:hypothetical protein